MNYSEDTTNFQETAYLAPRLTWASCHLICNSAEITSKHLAEGEPSVPFVTSQGGTSIMDSFSKHFTESDASNRRSRGYILIGEVNFT